MGIPTTQDIFLFQQLDLFYDFGTRHELPELAAYRRFWSDVLGCGFIHHVIGWGLQSLSTVVLEY